MHFATAQTVDKLIEKMITKENCDPYLRRLDNPQHPKCHKEPHCIYFYYICFKRDGCPEIRHYFYDNGGASIHGYAMRAHITTLAKNARSNEDNPPMTGMNFRNIEWCRKSYVAIFMDSPYWKLFKRAETKNGKRKGGIAFDADNGVPNHSFFDAVDLEIDMSRCLDGKSDMRSALYFINHMKREDEEDLHPDEKEKFIFDVFFDVKNPDGSSTCFIIDPDGTNMGPPAPPP